MATVIASFLLPEEFSSPRVGGLVRELGLVPGEAARSAAYRVAGTVVGAARRTTCRTDRASDPSAGEPVLLVPGFLAGDYALTAMARHLRGAGFRTYRSGLYSNLNCALQTAEVLEKRLETISDRRGSRVRIVGHSLGGMLARGLAVRRPDLVAGIVTLGSPMLAPGAHHPILTRHVEVLVSLSRLGLPAVMSADCVGGECARVSFEEMRAPLASHVGFTTIYSRRDGIADWKACIDPLAEAVEVRTSHIGMAFDATVCRVVAEALHRQRLPRLGIGAA